MFCTNCNTQTENNSEICSNCGATITAVPKFEPKVVKQSNYSNKQILLGCCVAIFVVAVIAFIAISVSVSNFFGTLHWW